MTGDKTQPQKLLEEIIPHENEDEKYPSDPELLKEGETKFPTIEEQQKYWEDKEKAAEPKPPRKWSLARRRKYNATVAKKKAEGLWNANKSGWKEVPPPPQEEPVAMIRFCPCCGKCIERFLA